jgi:hypothetical protein
MRRIEGRLAEELAATSDGDPVDIVFRLVAAQVGAVRVGAVRVGAVRVGAVRSTLIRAFSRSMPAHIQTLRSAQVTGHLTLFTDHPSVLRITRKVPHGGEPGRPAELPDDRPGACG